MLGRFSHVRLFETLCTIAYQALLSKGFSRQEYWSGLHVLFQGIFPTQDQTLISRVSCIAVKFFTAEPLRKLRSLLISPYLNCKEIQPVHPKGDQTWVFIGRTDVEAETPILWPPHAKS